MAGRYKDRGRTVPDEAASRNDEMRHKLAGTVMLVLLALVAVVAASFAWFSIADRAKARSLAMNVTGGNSLRFDLDAHESFDDYVKTLGFDQISNRIQSDLGVSVDASTLQPVTTSDYRTFTFEDGSAAEASSGAYLEFALHFMSQEDTVVHLTGADGEDGAAGTRFISNVETLPLAMRMSFTTDDQTWVYDPNLGDTSSSDGAATVFGLGSETAEASKMFGLLANTDKPVTVRIWLEGRDPNCTNMLKGADYSISLRFEGVEEQ